MRAGSLYAIGWLSLGTDFFFFQLPSDDGLSRAHVPAALPIAPARARRSLKIPGEHLAQSLPLGSFLRKIYMHCWPRVLRRSVRLARAFLS